MNQKNNRVHLQHMLMYWKMCYCRMKCINSLKLMRMVYDLWLNLQNKSKLLSIKKLKYFIRADGNFYNKNENNMKIARCAGTHIINNIIMNFPWWYIMKWKYIKLKELGEGNELWVEKKRKKLKTINGDLIIMKVILL